MRILTSILTILLLITSAFLIGEKMGALPNVIYEASPDNENLILWRKNWKSANNDIVSASVIGESADSIFVYVDYIYTGSHGDRVISCGNILHNGERGEWSCSPTGLGKGRGFIILRFSFTSTSKKITCSDQILIDLYNKNGTVFYEKTIPFKKVWVNSKSVVAGKLRELFSICP